MMLLLQDADADGQSPQQVIRIWALLQIQILIFETRKTFYR